MEKYLGREHRQYTRLDSVFPVQFRLASLDGKNFISDWLQGFTNDISKGGICLRVNNFSADFTELLNNKKAKLSLDITIPLGGRPAAALAKVAWVKEMGPAQYLIGLAYEHIDASDNARILRYAMSKKLFAPVSLGIIILLGLALLINASINIKLTQGNKALVSQLVKVMEEASQTKEKAEEITKERELLQDKIQSLMQDIQRAEEGKRRIQEEAREAVSMESEKLEELQALTERLGKEKI